MARVKSHVIRVQNASKLGKNGTKKSLTGPYLPSYTYAHKRFIICPCNSRHENPLIRDLIIQLFFFLFFFFFFRPAFSGTSWCVEFLTKHVPRCWRCTVVKRSLFSCRISPRQIPGGHYSKQKTTPFSRGCPHVHPLFGRVVPAVRSAAGFFPLAWVFHRFAPQFGPDYPSCGKELLLCVL